MRKIRLATSSVTTLVGLSGQRGVKLGLLPAGLNQPNAVTVLPTGELIVLDENSVLWAH